MRSTSGSFRVWKGTVASLLFLAAGPSAAVAPLSLTVSGTYGSPVAPSSFSSFSQHGFGLNALLDYNPMNMISVGVGFETITFDGAAGSSDVANLELKLFPFENGKKYFSPYLNGGVGINLNSTGGTAPFKLKAGLGTRVSVISSLYLDLGFESHWFVDPGASQHVGARAGLSYSFEFEPTKQDALAPQKQSAPAQKAAPKVDPKAKTEASSVESGTEISPLASKSKASEKPEAKEAPDDLEMEDVPMRGAKPTATPEEEEEAEEAEEGESAEEASVEDTEMMKLYRSGTKAYLRSDYQGALKDLRKSVAIVDDTVKALYYAEANALIGVIHYVKRERTEALRFLKKAVGLNPKNNAALKYLRKLGQPAQTPAEEVSEEDPSEKDEESKEEAAEKEEDVEEESAEETE